MLSTIAYGLTIGAILYLVSVGLSLTFGTMRIVNFAHGFIYTIGAYFLLTLLPHAKGHFFLCALVAVLLTIPISYAVERFIVRRLYGVGIDYAIIATYAVS
jgi:branched-subunit amino acid ABC-type transport system permease component